jgi:glutamate dehydrogenase/leucine dehydrogenase
MVNFPIKLDSGKTVLLTGYRVHHNHALGQIQGGTRFHPEETLEDIKALALWMTVKNSLNGLPAGGGKGGICCDPDTFSRTELERVCRAYVRAISPLMGTGTDFPGADIGTNAYTQSWMLDEWEQLHAMSHEPSAVSGKAVVIGGSRGRAAATGLGVSLAVRETCRVTGRDLKGLRVAVQGFGKVGLWAARILEGYGAVIVAVSDVKSGIFSEKGLNITELYAHVQQQNYVTGFPGAAMMGNRGLLTCECDVLIPAAVQGVINENIALDINAGIIVEGANGPVTKGAEAILKSQGVLVVPDILANGGGTVVAYLERVQGNYNYYWTEEEVHKKYEDMFVRTYRSVYNLAVERGISMRMAAWVMALRRVEEAIVARGWI